jgi:hypothetical protein
LAQYKIVGSYQIVDIEPTPDVAVAPASNSSYQFTLNTAEDLKQFVLANAAAQLAAVAGAVAQKQAILDAVSVVPAPVVP